MQAEHVALLFVRVSHKETWDDEADAVERIERSGGMAAMPDDDEAAAGVVFADVVADDDALSFPAVSGAGIVSVALV